MHTTTTTTHSTRRNKRRLWTCPLFLPLPSQSENTVLRGWLKDFLRASKCTNRVKNGLTILVSSNSNNKKCKQQEQQHKHQTRRGQRRRRQGENNDKRQVLLLFPNRSLLLSNDFGKRPIVRLTPPIKQKLFVKNMPLLGIGSPFYSTSRQCKV